MPDAAGPPWPWRWWPAAGAYVAVFVALGATVRRAAVWSLALVFLGERLIGTALSGIAPALADVVGRSIYGALGPSADDILRRGVPSGWGAVVRLAIVAAVGSVLAVWRIGHLGPAAEE